MEYRFTLPYGASYDDGVQECNSSALIVEPGNLVALVIEAELSVALREILGTILVDQFTLAHAAPNQVSISMNFRSPARYSEALQIEGRRGSSSALGDAALFLESHLCAAFMDLFDAIHIDEVSVDVNSMDQLTCSIKVSALMSLPGSEGN